MKRNNVFAMLLISFSLIATGCGSPAKTESSSNEPSAPPSSALIIKGDLKNGDTPTNTTVTASQDVYIKSLSGEVVGTAKTDANGTYEIPILAGALSVGQTALQLAEDTTPAIAATQYALISAVPDDGAGKALGINKTINITNSAVTSTSGSTGVISLGTSNLQEIGAITGSVSFSDTSVTKTGTDVYIPGKSFFVRTGSDGAFHLLFVPAGVYSLRIENGVYTKTVSVTVAANKTTILGAVTVGLSDRNPLPLADVLVGTWTSSCWSSANSDLGTATTGVLTITSLTSTSYTGASCLSQSTRSGASAVTLVSIQVLSDSSLYLVHKITSTSVIEKTLARVSAYSNNKMTLDFGTGFEVYTRASTLNLNP